MVLIPERPQFPTAPHFVAVLPSTNEVRKLRVPLEPLDFEHLAWVFLEFADQLNRLISHASLIPSCRAHSRPEGLLPRHVNH